MFRIFHYRREMPDVNRGWLNDSRFETEDAAWDEVHRITAEDWDTHTIERYGMGVRLDWQTREQARFDAGTYKPPMWANERFWVDYHSSFRSHFAHISTDDPTMLAYTPDDAKGEADRQVRLKPGKYLTKFFGASEKPGLLQGLIAEGPLKECHPVLTKQQIAYYAEWWENGERPPSAHSKLTLKFAETPEQIAKTYKDGIRSCMGGAEGGYRFKTVKDHPTRVYGAGDLQLAYLVDDEKKIRARAICWPEKKTFGRCYPAPQNWPADGFESEQDSTDCQNELRQRLRKMGYTDIGERSNVLDGARLLRIPIATRPGFYVMPYLDNDYGVVEAEGEDKEKFFLMRRDGDGKIRCQNTDGTVFAPPTFTCAHCDTRMASMGPEGETRKFQVFRAYGDDGPAEPQDWCSRCINRSSFMCRGQNVRFATATVKMIADTYYGHYYAEPWAKAKGMFTCAYNSRSYIPNDTHKPVTLGDQVYCSQNLRHVAFHCLHDGKDYLFKEMSLEHPGFPKSMDKDDIPAEVRDRFNILKRRNTYDLERLEWRSDVTWPYPQDHAVEFFAARHVRNETRRKARERQAAYQMEAPVQIMAAE
jgi:hypothetical protein